MRGLTLLLPAFLLLSSSSVIATPNPDPNPAPPSSITQLLERQAKAFDRAAVVKKERAARRIAKEAPKPRSKRDPEPFRAAITKRDPEPFRAAAITQRDPEPFRAAHTKREPEPEASPEPLTPRQDKPAKRAPEPEPFRAAAANTKRDPGPFRAAHTKRDPEPEPFRAAAANTKRDPEPFRAAHTKREAMPDPFRAAAVTGRAMAWHEGPVIDARAPLHHPRGLDRRAPMHKGVAHSFADAERGMQRVRRAAEPVEEIEEDEGEMLEERDVEGRDQYAYQASNAWSATDYQSATSSAAQATTTAAAAAAKPSGYFYGASSYYLHALADTERHEVLDALQAGGFSTLRIFIASSYANNKGSNSIAVNDLEPNAVGTYDDTILHRVDQLMLECSARGLKLIIALSDRYALGFWSTDAYALKLNIVTQGSSGAQQIANAASFYTSSSAIASFDNRLAHILSHQNSLMGGKTWAELDSVVYAFEAQNEPQGHMDMASSTWSCDRAAYLRSLLPSSSGILISSGGGITLTASLGSWATSCSSIDIISVHDYGTTASSTVPTLVAAQQSYSNKIVMLGEWGAAGNNKAAIIQSFVSALKAAGIPWMVWEVVNPGAKAADFEIWTDEPSWGALTGGAVAVAPTTTWAAATTWMSNTWVATPSSTWTSAASSSKKRKSKTESATASSTGWSSSS